VCKIEKRLSFLIVFTSNWITFNMLCFKAHFTLWPLNSLNLIFLITCDDFVAGMWMKMSFISASRPATEDHQNRRAALNFAGRERKRQRRCIAKFLAKFMARRKQPTTLKIHPSKTHTHTHRHHVFTLSCT